MRGWTTSDVKKGKKFNKNVSVRDLLQLFTKISEQNVFIQFYIFFTSEVVHPRIFLNSLRSCLLWDLDEIVSGAVHLCWPESSSNNLYMYIYIYIYIYISERILFNSFTYIYPALLPQHWALYAKVDSTPTFIYIYIYIYIYISLRNIRSHLSILSIA